MKELRILTYSVGALVAGIVFCFAMAIVTAVKDHNAKEAMKASPESVATPAF